MRHPVEIGAKADHKPCADGVEPRGAQSRAGGHQAAGNRERHRAFRTTFFAGNRGFAKGDAHPMRPERILADVGEALPKDAIITTDVGWNNNGVGQQFPVRWASARRRQSARSLRHLIAWSSRWSAMEHHGHLLGRQEGSPGERSYREMRLAIQR